MTDRSASGTPPLPRHFRPLGVRVAVLLFIGLLFVTTVVIWLAFPPNVRDSFTPAQKLTVLLMGLGVAVIGHALARCRVDADDGGLTVVNGYRTHRLAWEQVVAVTLRPGSPWAVLDLADGTSQAALGIQGSDGGRAQHQVRELAALVDARAAAEPAPRPRRDDANGDDETGDQEGPAVS